MCFSDENLEKLQSLKGLLNEDDDTDTFRNLDAPPDESKELDDVNVHLSHDGRTLSVNVVSVVAYLIGVKEEQFGKEYKSSIYDELQSNDSARIIRALCIIRNSIMRQPGSIMAKLRSDACNLDSIPEFIDPALFRYLESFKITIVTGSSIKALTDYITIINNAIANKINSCATLFPCWVNWDMIKNLIVMPNGGNQKKIQSAMDRMREHFSSYPFACYINWPIDRSDAFVEDPENYAEPVLTGNVINNDKKFLTLLYRINGKTFQDVSHVYDASEKEKDTLLDFLVHHDNITMLVDCENSDPYKLCAMLESMKEIFRRHLESDVQIPVNTIRKIILFDDYHTTDAWDVLNEYTNVQIIHEEVERVLNHKSLVDIAMSVGACKEHMLNGVNSFIIAASDSDYWGLMRALPDADFLVLTEYEKLSAETKRFYDDHDVANFHIDDFAGNLNKIRETALYRGLEKHLNNQIAINLYDTLDDLYDQLRIDVGEQEKENYRKKLSKKVQAFVADNGMISIKMLSE